MQPKPAVVLRAADIAANEQPYIQRLNPNPEARFSVAWLGRLGRLRSPGVSLARVPPGGESFAYHAHRLDDEWVYIVSGRALARIDGARIELAAGDFVAFPAPQVPHMLANPYDEELVYLFGGDNHDDDVLEYPDLGKRFVLLWDGKRSAFHEIGPAEYPFGRRAPPKAPPSWKLFVAAGWGSAIAEATLAVAAIAYERVEVDPSVEGEALDRLRAANPLGQLPTAVLPDGSVLTESAAIVLRAADLAPNAGLVPEPSDPARASFLRWLTFLVAAVYPTFTFGDEPGRYVKTASDELRGSTDQRRMDLWEQVEAAAAASGPWFLGSRFSAIDLYLAVMTSWRPGRAWFTEHCPRLAAAAERALARTDLAAVWRANFGEAK